MFFFSSPCTRWMTVCLLKISLVVSALVHAEWLFVILSCFSPCTHTHNQNKRARRGCRRAETVKSVPQERGLKKSEKSKFQRWPAWTENHVNYFQRLVILLKDYESLVFWKSPIVVITIMIPNPSFLLIVVSCDFMIHQLMAKLREYGRTHIFGYYYPAFRQTQVIDLDLPKTFKIANGSFFLGTWLNPYSGKWLANTG